MSQYSVSLERWSGPLDTLLRLIRAQEMDVFSVDLVEIGRQYLNHLRLIHFRNLSEASSFLEIAAYVLLNPDNC